MKFTKRVIAIVLSLLMIICALPVAVFASFVRTSKAALVTYTDLTFVVPEAIYLQPYHNSWTDQTTAAFEYYLNDTSSYGVSQNTYSKTGTIYYTYEGASSAEISYSFLAKDLITAASGTVSLSSSTISSGNSVTINSGTATVPAAKSGVYIQWKLDYTDSKDGLKKSAYAYTFVYKPYTIPAVNAIRHRNTDGTNSFAQSIAWLSGMTGQSGASGQKSANYLSSSSGKGLAGFLSADNDADGRSGNGSSAQFTTTISTKSKSLYAVFASTIAANSWFYANQTNSTFGDCGCVDWSGGSSTYGVLNFEYSDNSFGQYWWYDGWNWVNFKSTNTAYIQIDTSRFTNLAYIPNLGVGIMMTDNENSKGDHNAWYIADMSEKTVPSSGTGTKGNDSTDCVSYYNSHGDFSSAGGTTDGKNFTSTVSEGIISAVSWDRSILNSSSVSATQDYWVKCFFGNNDGNNDDSDYCYNFHYMHLQATQYNKTKLREAVASATKLMPQLGIKGRSGSNLESWYFDNDDSYKLNAFNTAYITAIEALTEVDGAYGNPDDIATALTDAIADLYTYYEFDGNGGTLSATTNGYLKVGSNASADLSIPTSLSASRTGYIFKGWSLDSGAKTGATSGSLTVGFNNKIYAAWTPITYSVKYNSNGGTGSMSNSTHTYDVAQNLTANAFTREGYSFVGWNTSSSATTAQYTDKQSVTNLSSTNGDTINLYAIWKDNSYIIRYNGNNNDGGTVPSDQSKKHGETITLSSNTLTRTGYTHTGWNLSADGTGTKYDFGASFSLNPKNSAGGYTDGDVLTLYADWTANKYKLYFYPYADDATCSAASQEVTYDSAVGTLPTPERANWYFNGWNTKSDGTGSYYSASTVYKQIQDTDLYANWLHPSVDDSYVIDYGMPVLLDVVSNDLSGTSLKSVTSGEGYTASISNGKILFAPTDAKTGIISLTFTVSYNGKDFTETAKVIPATNVYYEESFITFTDGSSVTWQNAGTAAADAVQTVDSLYGSDSSYLNSSTYSLGSAKYATVTKANKGGATAQFTFTGTGFDFYSLMNGSTGCAFVDIYQGTEASGEALYSEVINTYFGYSYGPLYLKDGKVSLDSTGTPIYYADAENPGEYFIKGSLMGTTAVTSAGQASGWVQGGSSDKSTIYQVPVISKTGLDYGTYTVVIEPRYSKAYDTAGKGSYDFYVDGFRVYDPVNPASVSSASDTDVYTAYTADKEYNPTYATLRSLLDEKQASVAFLETYENQATLAEYDSIGPKNEIYLDDEQSIAFNIATTSDILPEKISIGTKMVEGSSGTLFIDSGSKDTNLSITGTSDIYRDITDYVEWKLTDKGVYTTSMPVTIRNASGDGIVISLTKLKWSYDSKAASASAAARELVFSFDEEDLVKVNAMITAASKPDSISSEGVTLAWDKSSVALGETATLTITAPATFERAYYGAEVIPGYTENEDGTRSWTCTCTPTELQNVIYDVTLEDANGYKTDDIASAELKVAAPTVDINDAEISWEKDAVKVGEEAVMTVTTPADIVRVTVGDEEITDFTLTDGKKVFTYKVTNDTAGKYVYSVSMTETFGYTSRNANSPALTVEQYVVKTDGITAKWQNESVKAGEKAVLVITTPADITSVTVAGKTVTDSTVLEDGTKQFTIEIDTSSQGENSYAVTVTDGKGMTSASVATDILTITPAETVVPGSDTDTDGNTDDNTGSSTEEENLTFWQKLVKAFVSFWKWLVSLVKGLVK